MDSLPDWSNWFRYVYLCLGWVKILNIRVLLSPLRTLYPNCNLKYALVKGWHSTWAQPNQHLHQIGCFLSPLCFGRKLRSTPPAQEVWMWPLCQTATLTCATIRQTTPSQWAEAPLQAQPIPSAQAPRRLSRQPISTALPTALASHWLRGICWMLCWKRRNSSEWGGKYQLKPAWILFQTGLELV